MQRNSIMVSDASPKENSKEFLYIEKYLKEYQKYIKEHPECGNLINGHPLLLELNVINLLSYSRLSFQVGEDIKLPSSLSLDVKPMSFDQKKPLSYKELYDPLIWGSNIKIAHLPNGNIAACSSSSSGNKILTFSFSDESAELIKLINCPGSHVDEFKVLLNGFLLVLCDQTAMVFDPVKGYLVNKIELPLYHPKIVSLNHNHYFAAIAEHGDGIEHYGIHIFDALTGKKIQHFAEKDHFPYRWLDMCVLPDDQIVILREDFWGHLCLDFYNSETGEHSVNKIDIDKPIGLKYFLPFSNGNFIVWDDSCASVCLVTQKGQLINKITNGPNLGPYHPIVVVLDDNKIALAQSERPIKIYNPYNGQLLQEINIKDELMSSDSDICRVIAKASLETEYKASQVMLEHCRLFKSKDVFETKKDMDIKLVSSPAL